MQNWQIFSPELAGRNCLQISGSVVRGPSGPGPWDFSLTSLMDDPPLQIFFSHGVALGSTGRNGLSGDQKWQSSNVEL